MLTFIARWMLAIAMGALTAVAMSLAIALVWLPSSVSTVLQFRSGVIGSLRDPYFQKYRAARKSLSAADAHQCPH